jgi:hypothetical protein
VFDSGKYFQPSRMFVSSARVYQSEAPIRCSTLVGSWPYPQALDYPNILTGKNALAYFAATLVTKCKSFTTLTPGGKVGECPIVECRPQTEARSKRCKTFLCLNLFDAEI